MFTLRNIKNGKTMKDAITGRVKLFESEEDANKAADSNIRNWMDKKSLSYAVIKVQA